MSIHRSRQALIDYTEDEDTRDQNQDDDEPDHSSNTNVDANGTINHTLNEFNKQQQLRKLAKSIHAPTSDDDVRHLLRHLGEPITYFAEDRVDRRDRLQKLLTTMYSNNQDISFIAKFGGSITDGLADDSEMVDLSDEPQDEDEEEFYTPGDDNLLLARQYMATYSFQQAKKRISYQQQQSELPLMRHVQTRRQVYKDLKTFALYGTQSGFERPVSAVSFAPNPSSSSMPLVATGDWAGNVKVFGMPDLSLKTSFKGHTEKVSGLSWHPQALNTQTSTELNLISGGLEGHVKLWSLDPQRGDIGTLVGHESRVCKVDIHPSGRYAASASFDYTWRLWDLEHRKELMMQEGHSKEVFAVKFQSDGALVGSAGLDAIGRIWDLRTGKTIMVLDGHVRGIYSLDFSPNGYQVATASADNSVMIWDIRQVKSIFTIPAHTKMVSDVKFYHGQGNESGTFLATASADKSIKIWSADNWVLQKTLADNDRVLSLDISQDRSFIVSGTSDRYLKLWAKE